MTTLQHALKKLLTIHKVWFFFIAGSSSWSTEKPLFVYLNKKGFFPATIKNNPVYDPAFSDGSVKPILEDLGFKKVIHSNKNLWDSFSSDLKDPNTAVLCNPPWSKENWLTPFFLLLENLDLPFLLILNEETVKTNYFKLFEERRENLKRYHLGNKTFPFRNEANVSHKFNKVVICVDYPQAWNWSPLDCQVRAVFEVKQDI